MTTYYDIHCIDCDSALGLYEGRGVEDLLPHLAAIGSLVEAAAANVIELKVDCSPHGGAINAKWCREHASHRLRIRDEYGCFDGDCYGWVKCDACGTSRVRCRLPVDHEGPCLPAVPCPPP